MSSRTTLITGILFGPISVRVAVNSVCSSAASAAGAAPPAAGAAPANATGAAAVTPKRSSNFFLNSDSSRTVMFSNASSSWSGVMVAAMWCVSWVLAPRARGEGFVSR